VVLTAGAGAEAPRPVPEGAGVAPEESGPCLGLVPDPRSMPPSEGLRVTEPALGAVPPALKENTPPGAGAAAHTR
jgi:hypothetical protein